MGELFSGTFRDVQKDCMDMTSMLEQNGWLLVDGVVRKVAFTNLPLLNKWYPVEENSVSLFSAGEEVNRSIRPSMAEGKTTYVMLPYVLLTHKTMRFGLSQVAGGRAIGVLRYASE
jgi:hypothetical protein